MPIISLLRNTYDQAEGLPLYVTFYRISTKSYREYFENSLGIFMFDQAINHLLIAMNSK